MDKQHIFSFAHLKLLDNYAVITCNTAVQIDYDQIEEIETILQHTYNDEYFGLIANRENKYSVNPLAIKKLFSYKFIVAGAIVGKHPATEINAELENKIVLGAPIEFFYEMPPAIDWINEIVTKNTNS